MRPWRRALRLVLLGALVGYAGVAALLAAREDDRFEALATSLRLTGEHSAVEATRLMEGVHAFFSPRRNTKLAELTLEQREGWRSLFIGSVGDHLATACGECGAYAGILARTAQLAGWDVRLVQILDASGRCAHVANELWTRDGWLFVDAMFQVTGQPSGTAEVLDAAELATHWAEHPGDVTSDYRDNAWMGHGHRYTNWDAVPILLPVVRKGLELVKGRDWVDHFSLRSHLLNLHRVRMWFALGLAGLVLLTSAFGSWRRGRKARAAA